MSLETMIWWLKWSMAILCVVATVFPVWYGFFNRWWTTKAGMAILLLSIGVAAAWDLTFTFTFLWTTPSINQAFWIQMSVHVFSIAAGIYVLYALWYNRRHGQMVTTQSAHGISDE